MQLDGGFGLPKMRPREDRQTEVDGGGIERIDRVVEFEAEILAGIQSPGCLDQ